MLETTIKTVGVVITFLPSTDQICRIRNIAAELDFVFVVDNTESKVSCNSSAEELLPQNVRILINANAGGIAGALNRGVQEAVKQFGECYIFLLDQDSTLPPAFFRQQIDFAKANNRLVVAPKYFDINSRTFGNYTRLARWKITNIKGLEAVVPFETTFAITSGTLITSSLFKQVGFFREDFFIDHVDSEFCIRLHKAGHLILINPDVVFEHAIGNRKYRKLLGISFKPNFHSALRRYYAVRNGIFMIRRHFWDFPAVFWLIFLRIGYEYAGIVFFEDARLAKLKGLFWGIVDGVLNNSGRCRRNF